MGRMQKVLVGYCNPLLDITAEVTNEVLQKFGLKANDAILAQEEHKDLSTYLAKNFGTTFSAGGAGQNSMRAAQWLLPPKATAYVGCVGKDHFGSELRKAAEADGLTVHYLEDEATPTGTCSVLLTWHNRSLVANLAAANNYKASHTRELIQNNFFETTKFFYITGFFLTVSPETIMLIAEYSMNTKKTFCMNLSAPFICQFFLDPLLKALEYVDLLFGNESEALALAESLKWETKDIKEIALKIASFPKKTNSPRRVVITQGADPVIFAENGTVTEYPVPVIPSTEIIDTNGGGDGFVGGFLSQLVQDKPIDSCINAGNYVAGIIIRRSGISFPANTTHPSF